ncbi:hypothetical protein KO525_18640, partial [Psychrosphaera sp. B3R10]
ESKSESINGFELGNHTIENLNLEAACLVDEYLKAQKVHELNEFGDLMDSIKARMKTNRDLRNSIGA